MKKLKKGSKKKTRLGIAEFLVIFVFIFILSGLFLVPKYGDETDKVVFFSTFLFCLVTGILLIPPFQRYFNKKEIGYRKSKPQKKDWGGLVFAGLCFDVLALAIGIPATIINWFLSWKGMLFVYGGTAWALTLLLITIWYDPKGSSSSTSHKWVYKKSGGIYGDVTVKELYEHKHGAGSWSGKVSRERVFIRILLLAASALFAFFYLNNVELTSGITGVLVVYLGYKIGRRRRISHR